MGGLCRYSGSVELIISVDDAPFVVKSAVKEAPCQSDKRTFQAVPVCQ